jgi:hypothetical protein
MVHRALDFCADVDCQILCDTQAAGYLINLNTVIIFSDSLLVSLALG